MFNCFCQLIVLLYVCDNDTNFMIKVSIGVGLLIECWKLTKVRKSSKILVHSCLRFVNYEVVKNRQLFNLKPNPKKTGNLTLKVFDPKKFYGPIPLG